MKLQTEPLKTNCATMRTHLVMLHGFLSLLPQKGSVCGQHLPSISRSIRRTPEHLAIYRNWRFRFQMRIHLLGPGSTRGTQKLHRSLHLNFQEPSGHKGRLLISRSLYRAHLFPCRTAEKKSQTDQLLVGRARKARWRAVEKLKQCDGTGRKASGKARQTKVGLGCYGVYIHRSGAGEVRADGAGSGNPGDDHGREAKRRQEKSSERIRLQKHGCALPLSSSCYVPCNTWNWKNCSDDQERVNCFVRGSSSTFS